MNFFKSLYKTIFLILSLFLALLFLPILAIYRLSIIGGNIFDEMREDIKNKGFKSLFD